MHTLPFMHQTNTAGSGSRANLTSDNDFGRERSSFEPAMRDAASRTKSHKSSAHNESTNSARNNNAQRNSNVTRQEYKQNGRDEDLAGAANATQSRDNEDSRSNPGLDGESGEISPSAQKSKSSGELADTAGCLEKNPNSMQDSELTLTGIENEKLQKQLKAVIQILEQTPAGSEIAEKLQNILNGFNDSASLSEALPRLNLSEAQTQTLQQLLQVSQDGASLTEGFPRLNLSEAQTQTLQDTLATLKNINEAGSLDSSVDPNKQLSGKLTELLAQVEQTLRKSQQGVQKQTDLAQLNQPEIVDGFILRAEQDKNGFNNASKIDDPRFAALLNKSTEFDSLRERHGRQNTTHTDVFSVRMTDMNPQEQARAEMATANGETGKEILQGQAQVVSANAPTPGSTAGDIMGMKGLAEAAVARENAAVDFSAAQKSAGNGVNSTDPGVMTLKNGSTIPTARVVDQTIQHLSLHARGDSSVVTVKLYPEELGELNIRMVMEGDQLKLQIQAQNQQVRELLEQNFPRLRTAMEDQGVTVDDFQVSLGGSGTEGQGWNQAGEGQAEEGSARQGGAANSGLIADLEVDDQDIQNQQSAILAEGRLSVHI